MQQRDEARFLNAITNSNINTHTLDIYAPFVQPGGFSCYAGKANSLLIDTAGTVRRCACKLMDDNNVVGKINSDEGIVFDTYMNMRWLARQFEEKCKECFFAPACLSHSCPYKMIAHNELCCPDAKFFMPEYMRLFDKANLFKKINELG